MVMGLRSDCSTPDPPPGRSDHLPGRVVLEARAGPVQRRTIHAALPARQGHERPGRRDHPAPRLTHGRRRRAGRVDPRVRRPGPGPDRAPGHHLDQTGRNNRPQALATQQTAAHRGSAECRDLHNGTRSAITEMLLRAHSHLEAKINTRPHQPRPSGGSPCVNAGRPTSSGQKTTTPANNRRLQSLKAGRRRLLPVPSTNNRRPDRVAAYDFPIR